MFRNVGSKPEPPPASAGAALRMMSGGKRAGAVPAGQRPGKNLFAAGADPEPSDEIDIKVKKSGWALPFFLGAAAGVAGVIAISKLIEPETKKEK